MLPSVLALIVGRWSDEHGRKWPLTISAIGMAVCYSMYLVLTYFSRFCSTNLWILFLPSIPVALGGSLPVFMMASFSYLGDIMLINKSSKKETLYRFLICEACCAFGAPIGVFLGGVLFQHYGYWPVYLAAAVIEYLAAIYCVIRIRNDSVNMAAYRLDEQAQLYKMNEKYISVSRKNHLSSIVTFFKRMLKACFRSREGRLRTILIVMVICQAIATANYNLGSAIDYVYIKYKLGWSMKAFTEWKASYIAVAALGGVTIAPLLGKCFSEPLQASLAFLLNSIFTFLIGSVSVNSTWLIWISLIFPFLFLVPTSVARTIVTRIVTVDELGSVFGLISFIGGLTPMIMSTAGSSIFKYAVSNSINVGIVYFFASSLHLVGYSLCLYIDFLLKIYPF